MPLINNNVIVRLLIGLTFLTVIASAAVPSAVRHRTQQKSEDIAALARTIKEACQRHRDDTNILAIEFAAPDQSHDWASSSFHRLSAQQHYNGWQGPYLKAPLQPDDNPYGGHVSLCSDWDQASNLNFETGRHGFGQFLILDRIPESTARMLDAEFDGLEAEGGSDWEFSGSVRWLKIGGRLMIDLEINRR